jgi:hypothetical protein
MITPLCEIPPEPHQPTGEFTPVKRRGGKPPKAPGTCRSCSSRIEPGSGRYCLVHWNRHKDRCKKANAKRGPRQVEPVAMAVTPESDAGGAGQDSWPALCRHPGCTNIRTQARGLCARHYYDLAVRTLYPAKQRGPMAKQAKEDTLCAHCGQRPATRPRILCNIHYTDKLIRELYPICPGAEKSGSNYREETMADLDAMVAERYATMPPAIAERGDDGPRIRRMR